MNDREEILIAQELHFSLYNTMQPFSIFVGSLSRQPDEKPPKRMDDLAGISEFSI